MSQLNVGQILLNRYRVDAFIASGEIATVYQVWDIDSGIHLAMKVLNASLAVDPTLIRGLREEAHALNYLSHPNIVPFYGQYEDGNIVLLLERYINGVSLQEIINQRRGQPFPATEVMPFLKTLSSVLDYAHAKGVVHGDIQPGNVIVDSNGSIYLTGFGIAQTIIRSTGRNTTFGGPAYMSPEQISGEQPAPSSDVYSLGILLFELLTGRRPFDGVDGTPQSGQPDTERIRQAHLYQAAPDPGNINPQLSPALAWVVLKCLAKNPDERFHSADELFQNACLAAGAVPQHVSDFSTATVALHYSTQNSTRKKLDQGGAPAPVKRKGIPVWAWGVGLLVILLIAMVWNSMVNMNPSIPIETVIAPNAAATTPNARPSAIISGLSRSTVTKPSPQPVVTDTAVPTSTVVPSNTPEPTKAKRLTTGRVLWDVSHGPHQSSHEVPPSYDPTGVYSKMVKRLAQSGVLFETYGRSLAALDFNGIDAIVVNEWSAEKIAYTTEEAARLEEYVRNGGNLLIMADHASSTRHVSAVCERFGVQCYQAPNIAKVSTFSPHAITTGINTLIFGFEGGCLTPSPQSRVIATSGGNAVILVIEDLPGRVVILGDGHIFDNDHIEQVDDAQFAINVFRWLTRLSD